MPELTLGPRDTELLRGEHGPGPALAMRIVVAMAKMRGASSLLDISAAHIDGCLYHGRASLDLAERLLEGGAQVSVPTTLNVGSLDLLHPELVRMAPEDSILARRLMDVYRELGCRPTWTCAPYQMEDRPGFGDHIAWAESNAIAFANSVLGARTDRYGDFIDICAAVTGRAPASGLHLDEERRATILVRIIDIPDATLREDTVYPVLGHLLGRRCEDRVPAIEGLPGDVSEDNLKALAAAAASSGATAMFHVIGRTPEAVTADDAFDGRSPDQVVEVRPRELAAARDELSTVSGDRLTAVSLGTPHFSFEEFRKLHELLSSRQGRSRVEFYVSTGRAVLKRVTGAGWLETLEAAGVQVLTDTCTYVTPVIRDQEVVMTNSGKWAYYAPGNLGIDVVFGSLSECVDSALEGRVVRDDDLW